MPPCRLLVERPGAPNRLRQLRLPRPGSRGVWARGGPPRAGPGVQPPPRAGGAAPPPADPLADRATVRPVDAATPTSSLHMRPALEVTAPRAAEPMDRTPATAIVDPPI